VGAEASLVKRQQSKTSDTRMCALTLFWMEPERTFCLTDPVPIPPWPKKGISQ